MKRYMLTYAIFVAGLAAALPTTAQVVKVPSRDALKANTAVEWFEFGKDGGFVSTPLFRRFGTLKVGVASSSGELDIVREGTTWLGDFIPGQYLLRQPNQSDNLLVNFDPPVTAVGIQVDPGAASGGGQTGYVGKFIAVMCLYGGAHGETFLGMVSSQATADTREDNTARFLGARSAGTPIRFIDVFVSGVDPNFPVDGDLAINRLDAVVPVGQRPAELPGVPVDKPPSCR